MSRKWYVIYTRPRWEKKTDQLLRRKGVTCYCPLHKVKRHWSDRVRLVELPLLTSYVFVYVSQAEMTTVRYTPGVFNFVYWNGKPAVVKDVEVLAIQRFLDTYDDVKMIRTDIKPGDKVSVVAGPLMNYRGNVLEIKKKMVKIRIESLGYDLVAYVDKAKLTGPIVQDNYDVQLLKNEYID